MNDSMPNIANIITEEDMLILEEEAHLQHVTNVNPKTGGKIYNTHDGRQQKFLEEQATGVHGAKSTVHVNNGQYDNSYVGSNF